MKDYFKDVIPLVVKHRVVSYKKSSRDEDLAKESRIREFVSKESYLTPISRKQKRHFSSEKTIDLHGYTRDQAYFALIRFFNACQKDGVKKALVITGGNNMRNTTLRKSFQIWVREKFGNYITSCTSANIWHGGEGAFYVIIKRG